MRKIILFLVLGQMAMLLQAQLVADHTVVDQYDDIPQQYIDAVKTMLVSIPGESHSEAYRLGMVLLELLDNTYQAEIYNNVAPPASTDQYVRIGRHRKAGEDFFFSATKILEMKADISSQNDTGNPFDVMGFGWCWDMTWQNDPGGGVDPVHHIRWAGSTEGGPDGNMRWGLDSDDQALTGNSVSMDTYLEAVESYIQFCADNDYPTQWVFTTGPVDSWIGTEAAFQRELKHDHIRDYVARDTTRILFDYADILCWSNSGEQYTLDWNDGGTMRPHANIHPENMMDYDASWNIVAHSEDGDHIGEVGALRLAKAMWWMLAKMAGWGSGTSSIETEDELVKSDISIIVGPEHLRVGTSNIFDHGDLSLFDLNGRLIETVSIEGVYTDISTSSLSAGSYIVVASKEHHTEAKKIIILP